MRRGFVIVAAIGVCACGADAENWPAGPPLIEDLVFVEQVPQRPEALVFELRFRDSDGDLGPGLLLLTAGGGSLSRVPLASVFAAQFPVLDLDAIRGDFEVEVDVQGRVSAGDRLEIGFQLEDEAKNPSNEWTLILEASDS